MAIKIGNLDISSVKVGSADCAVYLGTVKLYPTTPPSFDVKYKFTLTDYSVVSGECDASSAITSAEISEYTATLKEVVIGDCVTSLSSDAFANCNGLTSIEIPDTVTSISNGVFYNCTSLTSIDIPDSVTSIGGGAFSKCNSLENIVIPSGVTSIGDYAFYRCFSLTSITVNAITPPTLGNGAFNNANDCPILVPIESINAYKTAWSTYADRIEPSNAKFYAKYSDSSTYTAECDYDGRLLSATTKPSGYVASAMTSCTIGSCNTTIGEGAFRDCSGLTRVNSNVDGVFNIPSGVTTLGDSAFRSSVSATTINLPDTVTSIGGNAFRYCLSLTSINIPSGVTSIGNDTFNYCSGLTSIDIPSGVTSIGENAFTNCRSLTSCTIPSGVTSIEARTFSACSSITGIEIPNTVTSIGDSAFRGCSSLTNLSIPSGVTSIGNNAFYNCSYLTNITIPSGITSIGNSTFRNCNFLTSIDIPSGVTSIGNDVFNGCSRLTSVTVNAVTPPTLGTNAFYNTNNCPIFVPSASVNTYKTSWATYASRIYAISRLPSGYTEVEYVQNTGTSVINSNFQPNSNTRIVGEMEMVTSNDYPKIFGAGIWNNSASLFAEYDNYLAIHWINTNSSTKYSSYRMSRFAYAKRKYDINKGSFYVDDTLVGTHTYSSTLSVSSPVGIFNYLNGTSPGNANEYFLGKLYSFKIYNNDVLARDFVPAIRNSDSTVGLYDVVNDVFYTSTTPLVAPPSA